MVLCSLRAAGAGPVTRQRAGKCVCLGGVAASAVAVGVRCPEVGGVFRKIRASRVRVIVVEFEPVTVAVVVTVGGVVDWLTAQPAGCVGFGALFPEPGVEGVFVAAAVIALCHRYHPALLFGYPVLDFLFDLAALGDGVGDQLTLV